METVNLYTNPQPILVGIFKQGYCIIIIIIDILHVHCRQPTYGYSENFDTYHLNPKVTEFHEVNLNIAYIRYTVLLNYRN